jgi:hypothetical protein
LKQTGPAHLAIEAAEVTGSAARQLEADLLAPKLFYDACFALYMAQRSLDEGEQVLALEYAERARASFLASAEHVIEVARRR